MHAYFQGIISSIESLPQERIEECFAILCEAYRDGKQVFTFGNGGSAATAIHFAADLNKTTITNPQAPRFQARSLAENISLFSAWANDTDYEKVFTEQLVSFLNPGDVVVAISGSGNSPNVVSAVQHARENGATTIGLCGFDGGKLGQVAEVAVVCANDDMLQIEDLHSIVCHYLTWRLREALPRL